MALHYQAVDDLEDQSQSQNPSQLPTLAKERANVGPPAAAAGARFVRGITRGAMRAVGEDVTANLRTIRSISA